MANAVGNLAVILSGNAAPLNATLTRAKGDIRAFASGVNGMGGGGQGLLSGILGGTVGGAGGMFGRLGGAIGGLVAGPIGGLVGALGGGGLDKAVNLAEQAVTGLASALASAGQFAVKSAADYEVANIQFGVMAGNAQLGTKLLEDLQKLAIATPFKAADLTKGAQMLMGMGISIEDIMPTMKALADLSAGDAERLTRLALAYGQVQSAGRLYGTELRQFTEAGVGVADFAKAAGMSTAELRAKMEAGAIGADVATKALNMLTGAGGRFFGMNEKVNLTVAGQWNAMSESVALSAKKIILKVFDVLNVAPLLGRLADFLAPLSGLGDVLEYPLLQLKTIGGDVFAFLRAGWDTVSGAAGNFKGVLGELTPSWAQVRDGVLAGLRIIGETFARLGDFLTQMGGLFAQNLLMPMSQSMAVVTKLVKGLLPAVGFVNDPMGIFGVKETAKSIAAGLDPEMFMSRMRRLQKGMIDAAAGTKMADTFAGSFARNLEGGAKAAQKANGFLNTIGKIPVRAGVPADVQQFAVKLKGEFDAGITPLEKLRHEMDLMGRAQGFGLLNPDLISRNMTKMQQEAAKAVGIHAEQSPLEKFNKAMAQIREAQASGLLAPGMAERGMSSAFDELAQKFGKTLETALPKAVMYGSQEAASVISHALNRDTSDPQQRIAAILQQAYQAQARTERHTADTARALRNLSLGSKGF